MGIQQTIFMKKLPIAITEEGFIQLIKHTKQLHHKVAFLLGYGSGIRISEVCNLQKNDINLKEKKIMVRQGKGSKDRVVPLPKMFKTKMLDCIPIKCKKRALQKAFTSIAIKSKLMETIPNVHFHSLRHGFASRAVENGMPIHHLRTLLGHSNISTTNVYLEMNPKGALKSYEELF